jgi:hypothetical protein
MRIHPPKRQLILGWMFWLFTAAMVAVNASRFRAAGMSFMTWFFIGMLLIWAGTMIRGRRGPDHYRITP